MEIEEDEAVGLFNLLLVIRRRQTGREAQALQEMSRLFSSYQCSE